MEEPVSFGLGNVTNNILNQIGKHQNDLLTSISQASSGKRITNASVDPSGLAIYESLTTQAGSFDQASANVQDARNAVNVAEGALSSTSDNLQRLSTLAVQASNDFLSPTQRNALQAEANQLVQQINTSASQVNFNGVNLLNGQNSGFTAATPASAQITANNALQAGGGNTVQSATAAAGATAGTFSVQVQNGAGGPQATVTFTDTATQQTTTVGTFAAGATVVSGGTTIQLGNFTASDTGTSATVQVTGATAASSNPSLQVQSSASEGGTTQVSVPNGTSSALGIANIDLSTTANATNAQGQINQALQNLSGARAQLGAQSVALGAQIDNNNIASTNLTASASAIGDDNAAQRSTELTKLLIENQVSFATLKNANTQFGFLNRFYNTPA